MRGFTDPEGYVFTAEFDANGNIIRSIDGRGYYQSFEFDLLNRLTATTDQAGFTSRITYDAHGNAAIITYDVMSRVSTMIDAKLFT